MSKTPARCCWKYTKTLTLLNEDADLGMADTSVCLSTRTATSLNELSITPNAGALDLLPGPGRLPKEARIYLELSLHPHGPLVVVDKFRLDLSVQVPQPPAHALLDIGLVILLVCPFLFHLGNHGHYLLDGDPWVRQSATVSYSMSLRWVVCELGSIKGGGIKGGHTVRSQ